jgi:TRAP-type C4-dicarboxylate transport system permease small subunit
LIRELRGLGITLPVDLDERTCQLVRELAAEKAAQLEGAKAVISLLAFIVVVAVFALCFWRYDIGVVPSVGAAILAIPVIWLGGALPIGYVLGIRAARRFKARLHDGGAHLTTPTE